MLRASLLTVLKKTERQKEKERGRETEIDGDPRKERARESEIEGGCANVR